MSPTPPLAPATLWQALQSEARTVVSAEPLLAPLMTRLILQPGDLVQAISHLLARELADSTLPADALARVFTTVFAQQPALIEALTRDIQAVRDRDSACHHYYQALCFYKGFHALCAYRLAHALWQAGQRPVALYVQSRMSSALDIDIHPAARIGHGVMLDHGTGIVIGETAVVGDHVSIMQGVTLGGTGKEGGDRHPKISDGVLISVGATILGNIRVGEGSQVAAGSVVLNDVPAHTIVAGVPAKVTGNTHSAAPALQMDHTI